MNFTKNKPTAPGVFWYKGDYEKSVLRVVLVRELGFDNELGVEDGEFLEMLKNYPDGLWSSPLEPVKPKCIVKPCDDRFTRGMHKGTCGSIYDEEPENKFCPDCGGEIEVKP